MFDLYTTIRTKVIEFVDSKPADEAEHIHHIAGTMFRAIMAQEQLVKTLRELVAADAPFMAQKLALEECRLFEWEVAADTMSNKDMLAENVPTACVRWNMNLDQVIVKCWAIVVQFDCMTN